MKRLSCALALLTSFGVLRASAVTVTSLADDGPGSLREAITLGGDIDFAVTGTIALTSGQLILTNPIIITGPGADRLTIARSSAAGTPEFRILTVNANVTISGVTISNGLIGSTNGYDNGGGVLARSGLTLLDCAVTDNRSVGGWTRGTGLHIASGGRLTAVNCLFARNAGQGFDSEGSAIYNHGLLALTNCTFSGNSAGYSAVIQNDSFSSGITIDSCTIFGNTARFAPALVNGMNAAILLRNSIVAGNSAWDGDWEIESRGHITSAGYNLIGFVFHGPGMDPVTPHPTDKVELTAAQLRLAPLANNGGPTITHALLTNSPAFEAGPTNGFPAADQRGVARPQFARCDIGALEANSFPPPATNRPPVAIAQSVTVTNGIPLAITLTGSDPDGDPLTFSIASSPVWGTLTGAPPNVVYIPVTNSPDWDFFAFRVNDGQADSAPAAVNITVLPGNPPQTNQPPTVRIVTPANGAIFNAPANIVLIAGVHDPDGNAWAATVEFFAGTNKIGNGHLFDPGPPHDALLQSVWTNVPPGEYALTAVATDEDGASAASIPVHISVRGDVSNHLSFRLAFNHPNGNAGVFFQDYTSNGPTNGARLLPADRVLPDGGGRYYYGAKPHMMWRVDAQTGAIQQMDPGAGLPELSWPMGVAFDSQRQRVLLTSLGGEGFLYGYSPASNLWSVVRTMDNRDVDCIEYHASQDALYAVGVSWGGGPAWIYRFNPNGELQGEIPLPPLPFSIGPGGYISELVSVGDYLVLLLEADPISYPFGESRIYLIDPRTGQIQLTYHRVTPRPNLPPAVQINSPANGQLFSAPANISLVAYAQDPEDGYNVTVEFFEGTNSLGFGTFVPSLCPAPHCPNFMLTWSNVPPGQYTLTAKARDTNGAATVSAPARITVYDPALSLVTIRAADASASEVGNTNTGAFTVFRDGNTNDALTVFYSISGSASNGVDYVALSNSVDLLAGVRTATILVVPIDDTDYEGLERVELRLLPIIDSPPPPYFIGSPSNAVVTIADNEPPPPPPVVTIHATVAQASEAGTNTGQFTVYRTGPTLHPLYVYYRLSGTASNNVDYARLFQSVVIPAGSNSAPITVTPIDDNLIEGTETVVATLSYSLIIDPIPWSWYTIGSPSNAVVTIDDDEPPLDPYRPTVTTEATDPQALEPGGWTVFDPAAFTVYRAGNTTATLYVQYRIEGTASNALDYVAISNTVVIPAGKTSARIQINPLEDNLFEGTETVTLRLEEPMCIAIFPPPPDCYRVGTPSNATVHIIDSDGLATNRPPTVHIFTPASGATFVAPANIFIAVQAQDVDGYMTIQTVEFFAGTNSLGVTTNFPTMDPIGPFKLVWTNVAVGAYVLTAKATDSGGAFGISPPVAIHVIATNLPPTNGLPFVTITTSDALASEGTNYWRWPGWSNGPTANICLTNTAAFVVRRTGGTNTALQVRYEIHGTASNGVDYATVSGFVTIPAGHRWAEISIAPVDDALPEGIETVVLALAPAPLIANAPGYIVGEPRRAAAAIVDDDQARPLTGMLPNRLFHLMAPAANGTWWRIESSTNLTHWSILSTNSVTDGALHFVDPDVDQLPQRFYRAVPELNPPTNN